MPDGQRVGLRPLVGVEADDRLQQRRGELIGERDEADLPEVELEARLQHRIDRRQQRLQHVVQQVADADGDEHGEGSARERTSSSIKPNAPVLDARKRIRLCAYPRRVVPRLARGHLARQQKRVITEQDLLKFVWIADPQMSPDGRQVVFVRVVVNEKTDDYDTSVWIVPADGRERRATLTSGTRDTSPRWSPDGKRIAFVRAAAGSRRRSP